MLERDNDKPGANRLVKILAAATLAVAVASSAIVGTVAAQTSRQFDDVPRGHYAYEAIEWASSNGITEGCGDGTNFCPADTLNRAHMVTFLKRYHDQFHGASSSTPTDQGEVVIPGTGRDITRSIALTSGWYAVEFVVEDDSRLGQVTVTAFDLSDETLILVDQVVSGDFFRDTIRVRVRVGVDSVIDDALEPGRIWFEVDVGRDAEWTITVSELS